MEKLNEQRMRSETVLMNFSWRKLAVYALALLLVVTLVIIWRSNNDMWTQQTSTFFKSEKPYGAGDFRIDGQQVVSVKVSLPAITFKTPEGQASSADWTKPAEVTEAWMNDVGERKNRSSVRFLMGAIGGPINVTLTEPAQHAAWWASPDWRAFVVATSWTDYKQALAYPGLPVVTVSKMFRSVNGGKDWARLEWPEGEHVSAVRFLDGNRGYAFGKGPIIWRTMDGGQKWQQVTVVSSLAGGRRSSREMDVSLLSSDGTLWFADNSVTALVPGGEARVFSLAWVNNETLNNKESAPIERLHLSGQSVVDMQVHRGVVWILSCASQAQPPSCALLRWHDGVLSTIKSFPSEVSPGALYVLDSGTIVVDATVEAVGSTRDVLHVSRDDGKTWLEEDEGKGAQGVYMNGKTGERWRVTAYTLSKRLVK